MKEIVVTKCGPEQDRYYVIDGGDVFENGGELTIEAVEATAELFDHKIREVTRLHVEVDATVVVDVDVEGDEDAAFERASKITQAFEQEVSTVRFLKETDSVSLGIAEPIYWRNEDSGEETYK